MVNGLYWSHRLKRFVVKGTDFTYVFIIYKRVVSEYILNLVTYVYIVNLVIDYVYPFREWFIFCQTGTYLDLN